jgi:hypothetical protein
MNLTVTEDLDFKIEHYREFGNQIALMRPALEAQVRLRIADLSEMRERIGEDEFWRHAMREAPKCGQLIAECGDTLMFRAKRTPEVFRALCEGVALLACVPGGVKFLGLKFQATKKIL